MVQHESHKGWKGRGLTEFSQQLNQERSRTAEAAPPVGVVTAVEGALGSLRLRVEGGDPAVMLARAKMGGAGRLSNAGGPVALESAWFFQPSSLKEK
jgi:hypothetical protein